MALKILNGGAVTGDISATGNVTGANLNISNWDTAFGWGNHATAGYLTSFDITTQTDPKYLRSDVDDTADGNLTLQDVNITNGKVLRLYRSSGAAHQRVDARLDGTDQARLYWYGKTDTQINTGFKHAWYDGANYINVTASNPGVVTFDATTPVIKIDGAQHAGLQIDRGSASYDANLMFQTAGSTKFRIWLDAADALGIRDEANATEMVTFKSGGNVGIGTTSPSSILHIGGGTVPATVLDGVLLTLPGGGQYYQASDGTKNIFMGVDSSSYGILGMLTNHPLGFRTNNTERVRIDTSGNVGIGTTSPDDKLDIEDGRLRISNSTSGRNSTIGMDDGYNFYIKNTALGNLHLGNGTTTYVNGNFSVDNGVLFANATSNNVGIGTTSPSEKLEVAGNAILDANNARLKIKGGVAGTNGGIDWTFNTDATSYAKVELDYDNRGTTGLLIDSGYPLTLDYSASRFAVQYNGVEQMRINTSGNVGIGTTSPTEKLHVSGNGVFTGGIYVNNTSAYLWNTTNGVIRFGTNNLERARIDASGNVGINTTSPTEKLDVSGNINIADGSTYKIGGLNVLSVDPVTFTTTIASAGININPITYQFTFGAQNVYFGTFNAGYIPVTSQVGASDSPLYVDPGNNNVGIGTTAPEQTFEVRNGTIGAGQGGGNLAPINSNDAIIGTGVGMNGESGAFWTNVDTQIFLGGVGANSAEGIRGFNSGELLRYSPVDYNLRIGGGMITANPVLARLQFLGNDVLYGNVTPGVIPIKNAIGVGDSYFMDNSSSSAYGNYGGGFQYKGDPGNTFVSVSGYPEIVTSAALGGFITYGSIMSAHPSPSGMDASMFGTLAMGGGDVGMFQGMVTFDYRYGQGSIQVNPMMATFSVFDYLGSNSLNFDPNGANTLFAPSFTPTSDRKVKENITPVSNGLDVVCGLQGVEYDLKANGNHSSGFIAQDVKEVVPHAVVDKDDILRLNYNALAAYHNEAIKELKGMIDELKNEIAELKK